MAGANAGRKPAPPNLRVLKGKGENPAGQQTDSAGRPLPVTPDFRRGIPQKPFELEGDASDIWDMIVRELGRVDVLKPIDGPALEMACETYARWKEASRQRRKLGALAKNSQGVVVAPWVRIESEASNQFRAWCSEFGLTPAAENKVGDAGGESHDDNPFIWTTPQTD